MKALHIPVILVVGSYLGALSHGLTAADTLLQHDLSVAGIIVNESAEPAMSLTDTLESFRNFLPTSIPIHALPRQKENATVGSDIPDLTGLLQ